MKRLVLTTTTLLLLVAPAVLAQDEAPRYLSIFTGHSKLGHQPQYEAAVKDLWGAMKKVGADFPVFASQSLSSPGHYSFVTTLSSMADMDRQAESFNKAFAMSGTLLAELTKHSSSSESNIIAPRSDLSYQPASPRVAEAEQAFARITYLYARPEHAIELEGVIREFGELNAKKGITDGYGVYQNVTGEGPMYAVRTLARSEADYHAQAEKNNEKLGEEGAALRAKAGPMLVRIEYSSSVARPDLTYQPE